MKAYKKLAKAGWTIGKGEKESSNRAIRRNIKVENQKMLEDFVDPETERLIIKSEISHDEYVRENHLYDLEPKPKRKTNNKKMTRKQLESKLLLAEKKLDRLPNCSGTADSLRHLYSEEIKKLKQEIENFK